MKQSSYLFLIAGSVALCCLTTKSPTLAQISPDDTLPDSTTVMQSGNVFEITEGTEAGKNLFHSFREFSVRGGDVARFINNNAAIRNVINRVTGSSASEIFGGLEAGGSAPNFNLFLLNPNGIIFGPNASLNLNGSFVATTANAIQFAEQGFFSASSPNDPSLLKVNPSAFLFNQIAAQPIINRSVSPNPLNPSIVDGLRVTTGQSLLLVGGEVRLEGGRLRAPDGRVELAGIGEPGKVGLNVDDSGLRLSFPDGVARTDVLLTNVAFVDVEGGGRGNIAINARNLDILETSRLRAGIGSGLGSPGTQAGDIEINATGAVTVSQGSGISNNVGFGAVGNAGSIRINAKSLTLITGSLLRSSAFGEGKGGDMLVQVDDAVNLSSSEVFTTTLGKGNAGNIRIQAGSLTLTDFSSLNATSLGEGKAGNINIQVNTLSLTNSARISTLTNGEGDAGKVTIDASDTVSLANSTILSDTSDKGNGGNVNITTRLLTLTNDATVSARTTGEGNAANIQIDTDSLRISEGAEISAFTSSTGKPGNIFIRNADSVSLSNSFISTAVNANAIVNTNAEEQGGNIDIQTRTLSLTNGAQVNASTSGQGDAGRILVRDADSVSLSNSSISTAVNTGAVGQGGNVEIQTGSLSLEDSALLNASTAGQGNAGSVTVQATETVSINASNVSSAVEEGKVGNAGSISLSAPSIVIADGSQLTSSTAGEGNAGTVTVTASESVSISGSTASSAVSE